jgi:hypothetical protein
MILIYIVTVEYHHNFEKGPIFVTTSFFINMKRKIINKNVCSQSDEAIHFSGKSKLIDSCFIGTTIISIYVIIYKFAESMRYYIFACSIKDMSYCETEDDFIEPNKKSHINL